MTKRSNGANTPLKRQPPLPTAGLSAQRTWLRQCLFRYAQPREIMFDDEKTEWIKREFKVEDFKVPYSDYEEN